MAGPPSFGTAFAVAGFSFDPNLSPNNQGFANAVLATAGRAGLPFGFEPANVVLAGPAAGAAALPTYRALVLADISAILPFGGTGTFSGPTNKVSGTSTAGTSTAAMRSDAAPALDWAQSPTWTGNHIFNPATGTPLVVQIAGVNRFQVNGTTTSIQGQGPVAGALVDMTPDSTTFQVTLTGVTPSVTGTLTARRMGNMAILTGEFAGTSNTNACTLTGVPAAWVPAFRTFMPCNIENNGANIVGLADFNSTTIVLAVASVSGTFVNYTAAGFTASGQKGLSATTIGPYRLA